MLFGMAMSLTKLKEAQMEHRSRPCYAALGLANDYFSFDIEYEESKASDVSNMTNAVWLFMKWRNVSVEAAKAKVKDENFVTRGSSKLCAKNSCKAEHSRICGNLNMSCWTGLSG